MSLEIKSRHIGSAVVVDIEGEVDMNVSPKVRTVLVGLTDKKTAKIIVSLKNVPYIDSSGLATLVECLQGVGRYKGKLHLIGINDDIKDVFQLARLYDVFDICPDEATALAK
ncbi:MAG: STAS domain-containing protein [Planctomycetota bacterium]